MTLSHVDKLGLQAAIGDDLKRMLWGWLGAEPKRTNQEKFTLAAGYVLSIVWFGFAVWLGLHSPAPSLGQNHARKYFSFSEVSRLLQEFIRENGYPTEIVLLSIIGVAVAALSIITIWLWFGGSHKKKQRLLLIIDDLDRMPSSEMLDVIEQIKLFSEESSIYDHVQTLMICEEDVLRSAIARKYDFIIEKINRTPENPERSGAPTKYGTASIIIESTIQKLFIAHLRLPPLAFDEQRQFFKQLLAVYVDSGEDLGTIGSSQEAESVDGLIAQRQIKQPTKYSETKETPVSKSSGSPVDANATLPKETGQESVVLSELELESLVDALPALLGPTSPWIQAGPRALTSFMLRYKLARSLLYKHSFEITPDYLATALARCLASGNVEDDEIPPVMQSVLRQVT